MQQCKKISQISTLNGIKYEDYIRFKALLPDDLTSRELLQIRWILTHASYLFAPASILILSNDPSRIEQIEKAILFLERGITISKNLGDPSISYDMAVIFENLDSSYLQKILKLIKPNGYIVLNDDIDVTIELSGIEVCGLKIYRKTVHKEDVDIKIHIFIPVHNGIEQTLQCLNSIDQQTMRRALNITIIDDGSSDGTTKIIREQFPDMSIISGDGSLWWTGAIAKALQTGQTSFHDGDYFLLVNNDVVLSTNSIFSLLKDAIKDRSLCMAPLAFTQDESIACGEASDGHIFYRFEQSSKVMMQDSNSYSVLSLFGRCTLYPVEILQRVNNFDATMFPHYWGDTDFSLRAKKFGYTFKITGKTSIMVQHDHETTGSHHAFFSRRRTFKEVYAYLFEIKSLGNIKYLWRFYSRHYPKQKYKALSSTIVNALKQIVYTA